LPEFPEDVRGRVRINSRVDGNSALLEIFRRHSVFVLPSYFEGQPLVTIEAAALGMPIVTTHVCGMRDFIEPGKNGLTAPVADPAALAKALNHLLDSPEEARHFGLRALKLG
jgi:glycosyltransferase involved in cell wall biosynthesis